MKKIIYLAPLALLGIGAKASANQVSTHISNALRVYEEQRVKPSSQFTQSDQTSAASPNGQPSLPIKKSVDSKQTGFFKVQPVGKIRQTSHISRLDSSFIFN